MQSKGDSQPQWHPSVLLYGVVSARPSLCVSCVSLCASVASVASQHSPQLFRVCNCISACLSVSVCVCVYVSMCLCVYVSVSVSVSHLLNERHADH